MEPQKFNEGASQLLKHQEHALGSQASAQTEVMYDKCGAIMVISKSSFLPKELERRILKGYCRGGRPNSTYICIYCARGPIRGH